MQVTLRYPTPLAVPLQLETNDPERSTLSWEGRLIAEGTSTKLDLDIPRPPPASVAAAAEPDSPSHYQGHGVHPTCFGCGTQRGDSLRLAAGPVEVQGVSQVAAVWNPDPIFSEGNGNVAKRYVVAALDCPGAFAFISRGERAGLLGRIVVEQFAPVQTNATLIVTGWCIGKEGRKLFAGTALFSSEGEPLAAARATWFTMPGS